jgi:hypothetical protein
VFDETIFPFAHLHDTAGALLQKEILFLPHHLLNPGCGDVSCNDQLPADVTNESGSAEVVQEFFEAGSVAPSFAGDPIMQIPATDDPPAAPGTNSEEDPPDPPAAPGHDRAGVSASGTPTSPSSPRGRSTTPAGDSRQGDNRQPATASPALSPGASPTASRHEPMQAPRSSTAGGSGATTAAAPSATIPATHSDASPEQNQRPRTRLQSGIVRPKKFTDGTIRYGMYSSTGEPSDLNEALGNPKWKRAMEEEYNALIKNKTWHLVPARKGMNIIDC